MRDELFRIIDELSETYCGVLEDVANIESPTLHKAGVDAVGGYMAERAAALGLRVERLPMEKAGDVWVFTLNPESPAAPICLSGHTDTVHPIGAFGTPPCHREGDRLYGPGVMDCKGGVVAALLAMEALARVGYTARPVMLLLQCDEEMGSRPSGKASIQYICERAKGARAFFNLEGGNGWGAVLRRKGINTFIFRIAGKAGHASRCATEGASAILEAAHKIIACEQFKDPEGITCSCGVISGGTVSNAIPDECTFKADVRYFTMEQRGAAIARMEEIAATVHVPGTTCTVSYGRGRAPMEYTQRNADLLDDINRIYEQNGLSPLEGISEKGGSDAADVTIAGIPCLDNLGVCGGRIHSVEEYCLLPSIASSAKRLALAAYYL